jgi:multidrug efflux pump subunit AcrB
LTNKELFRKDDLKGLSLPDEANDLLALPAKKLDTDQVRRLNRLALGAMMGDLLVTTGKIGLPAEYEIKYAGQDEEKNKAQAFLLRAGVIALILIVLIMVTQFNTLSVPLVIMSTVVLSLIGVFCGLLVCHMPFGIVMTGIGVISLAGIVVKNGIVLMDFTRKLQRRGLEVTEACVEAGAIRLRPVLLTAVCTVLGLVPTALGWSFDFHTFHWVFRSEASQWWKSIAIAIIFGLSFATVLTLVVVPSLYVMIYKVAAKLGLGGIRKPESPQTQEDRSL